MRRCGNSRRKGHDVEAKEFGRFIAGMRKEKKMFDQVLAIVDGENTKFGAPVVEGAKVDATVVKNGKGKKIRIFKYTPKKGYRKRQGHRQPYTKVEIGKISF